MEDNERANMIDGKNKEHIFGYRHPDHYPFTPLPAAASALQLH